VIELKSVVERLAMGRAQEEIAKIAEIAKK
jgi:hypothetical protein